MKKDLISSIAIAVLGVVIAFIVCNLLIGEIEDVKFSVIDSSINAELTEPDPEIFNYKALNPTVEVYVGNCTEYNDSGECIEETSETAQNSTENDLNQENP